MRALLPLPLLAGLAACSPADVVTVPVFGRSLYDIHASYASGRDCSIVRLEAGQTYCAARYPTERPLPFCTRTIGTVTCWETPTTLASPGSAVGDTPPPSQDQLRYRAAPWPKSLFF